MGASPHRGGLGVCNFRGGHTLVNGLSKLSCRAMKNEISPGPERGLTWVHLTRGARALVDTADLPKLASRRWCSTGVYALSREGRTTVLMHRLLCVFGEGPLVRHLNGNSLDNRKCNLRWGTDRQNQQEQKIHLQGRKPGYSFHSTSGKWQAKLEINKRCVSLGLYTREEDAAEAYALEADLH